MSNLQERLFLLDTKNPEYKPVPVLAEVCEDHATGLLNHFSLLPLTGMAFRLGGGTAHFHTTGMQFSIDVLYVRAGQICAIQHSAHPGLRLDPVDNVDLVLEAPAGFCKLHGIKAQQWIEEDDQAFEEAFEGERVPREIREPFMKALQLYLQGYDIQTLSDFLTREGHTEKVINLVAHALKRFDLFDDLLPDSEDEFVREEVKAQMRPNGVRENVTLDDTIGFLNILALLDPDAAAKLVDARVPCNASVRDHPTIQVHGYPDRDNPTLGALGFLNGLFGIDEHGSGPIAAEYYVNCPNCGELPPDSPEHTGDDCLKCGETIETGRLSRFRRITPEDHREAQAGGKEYAIWGVPPGTDPNDPLAETLLMESPGGKKITDRETAEKYVKMLEQEHGCTKVRIQELDLSQDLDWMKEIGMK